RNLAALIGLPQLDNRVGNDRPGTIKHRAVQANGVRMRAVDKIFAARIGQRIAEEWANGLAGGRHELRHQWSPPSGSIQVRFDPVSALSQRYPSAYSGVVMSWSYVATRRSRASWSTID